MGQRGVVYEPDLANDTAQCRRSREPADVSPTE